MFFCSFDTFPSYQVKSIYHSFRQLKTSIFQANTVFQLLAFYCKLTLPFSNIYSNGITTKNTVISPNFLVQKFCGKAQFSYSFGQFAPGNQGKLGIFRSDLCWKIKSEGRKLYLKIESYKSITQQIFLASNVSENIEFGEILTNSKSAKKLSKSHFSTLI